MKMQQKKILKLFTLVISTSFLCTPTFGEPLLHTKKAEGVICYPSNKKDEVPVSLQVTLERAYMQNAPLDAARATLRQQVENLSQAEADWRPSISVEGIQNNSQVYPIEGPNNPRRTHRHSTSYQATITQNIYDGGATIANTGVQQNNTFSQKASLFSSEQDTLFSAARVHANIIAEQDIVKYLQESVGFYKQFYERTKARFEVGEASRPDMEASLAEYERAKGDLSTEIGNLEAAKAQYFQIVGSPPDNLAPTTILLELPTTYEDALKVALDNNPSITASRFTVEAALYNIDLQVAELLPTLDVRASVGNSVTGGTGFNPQEKETQLIGQATLEIPIYLQGKPSSRIRQAYQNLAEQKVNLVQAQRVVEQDTKTSWEQLVAAREALKGYMAAVKAGEIAVEGAEEEANVGLKSVVDVLEVQDKLVRAQIELVTAQEALIVNSYAVLQAMGSLMASVLKLNVRYYDPDMYYNMYKDAWIQFWQTEDWRYVRDEPCGPICKYPPCK